MAFPSRRISEADFAFFGCATGELLEPRERRGMVDYWLATNAGRWTGTRRSRVRFTEELVRPLGQLSELSAKPVRLKPNGLKPVETG